jgi:hypothetical protein
LLEVLATVEHGTILLLIERVGAFRVVRYLASAGGRDPGFYDVSGTDVEVLAIVERGFRAREVGYRTGGGFTAAVPLAG